MINEFTPLELSGVTNFSAYTHASYNALHSARAGGPPASNSSNSQNSPPHKCVAKPYALTFLCSTSQHGPLKGGWEDEREGEERGRELEIG